MPRYIMENLIESDRRGFSRRSVMMKVVSAGIETGVIGLLVLIPLLGTDSMPSPPEVMMTFAAPPPPPPPPPPPAGSQVKSKKASIPKPIAASDLIAPVEAPSSVPAEDFAFADAAMGGIETGVPGGAVDGVEGGIPGGPVVEPVRVGGEVRPPTKVKDVRPEYPATARIARVEGTVILEAIIDARGVVADVRVLKSIPLLDEAAIEAVRQWRYQATMLNGEAVPIVMTVTVNFGLERA